MSEAVSLNQEISAVCQLENKGLSTNARHTFPDDINKLLNLPLIERKYWLVLFRAAREIIHGIRIQDEFTDPSSHSRTCVSLQ